MKIKRITTPVFLAFSALVLLLTFTGKLPNDMMGAFGLMFVLGILFGELGDHLPIVKDWLGGGPILCIFGPALLLYFKILPKGTVDIMKTFMDKTNFFAFFIAIMISGAIFTISRRIIVSASLRYVPALVGGLVCSTGLAMLGGLITGYGWKKALFYLAIPIMGGGVGAGAVPLSQIYAKSAGVDAAAMLSTVMPAVILGNVFSILAGVVFDKVGKARPSLTGNGNLMKVEDKVMMEEIEKEKNDRAEAPLSIESLGTGFFVAIVFYLAGLAINAYLVPSVHAFVWLILLLTVTKALKLLPASVELSTIQWSNVWVRNLIYAALIPIGLGYVDIAQVITAVANPAYLLISVLVVVGAAVGAAVAGKFVGLYPVESGISAGLCMSNMAQTGDLAVLSAAKRMDLMPFAAYSSRIGGSLVLVLAGVLVTLLKLV
jgi:Na+/citrate or Na+/malate symporter